MGRSPYTGMYSGPVFWLTLLNYDAFNALGKFEPSRDNIFNRLKGAWASTLGLSSLLTRLNKKIKSPVSRLGGGLGIAKGNHGGG